MSLALKRHLFSEYGGFADRRVKDITKDRSFQIDDVGDYDVAGNPCSISVRVTGEDVFTLSLRDNAPVKGVVEQMLKSRGGTVTRVRHSCHAQVELTASDHRFIDQIAKEIGALVGRGRRYENPNWKWICPRTRDSLRRFSSILRSYQDSTP